MANPTIVEMLASPVIMALFLVLSSMASSIPDRVVLVDDDECDSFTGDVVQHTIITHTFSTEYIFTVEGERNFGGGTTEMQAWEGDIWGSEKDLGRYPAGSKLVDRKICPSVKTYSGIESFTTGLAIALFD